MASPGSSGCSRRRTLLTQTAAGTISRTIRDGTFLPGAPLIITNPETAQPRTLVADMVGRHASPDLLPACRDERVAARAHLRWLRCLTYIDGVDVQSPHACIRRQRNAVARANRRPGDLRLTAKSHT